MAKKIKLRRPKIKNTKGILGPSKLGINAAAAIAPAPAGAAGAGGGK